MKRGALLTIIFISTLFLLAACSPSKDGKVDIFKDLEKFSKKAGGKLDELSKSMAKGPNALGGGQRFLLRGLMFFIIFSLAYLSSAFPPVLKDNRNSRIIISLIIAGIAAISIPITFLSALFQAYSSVFLLVLGGGPAAGLYYLTFAVIPADSRGAYVGRGVVGGMAAYFTLLTGVGLLGMFESIQIAGADLARLIAWLMVLFGYLFIFLYSLVYCFFFRAILGPEQTKAAVTTLPRPLSRLARKMYRYEQIIDSEKEELDELVTELERLTDHTNIPKFTDNTALLDGKDHDFKAFLARVKKLEEDLTNDRLHKVGVDLFSRAQSTGNRSLAEDAAGLEKTITDIAASVSKAKVDISGIVVKLETAVARTGAPRAGQLTHSETSDIKSAAGSAKSLLKAAKKAIHKTVTLHHKVMKEVNDLREAKKKKK